MRHKLRSLPALILLFRLAIGQNAGDLQKHVEYLASDELAGRALPSHGMDAAASYIAKQFRAIGLDPAGDEQFDQTFHRILIKTDLTGYVFKFQNGPQRIDVLPTETLLFSDRGLTLDNVEVIKVDPEDQAWLKTVKASEIKGKVLIVGIVSGAEGLDRQDNFTAAMTQLTEYDPALILMYGPTAAALDVPGVLLEVGQAASNRLRFPIRTDALRTLVGPLPAGPTELRVTLHLHPPTKEPVKLRNVAGMLRGTDPNLKNSYIVVAANYDGFPTRRLGSDHIANSANTNASGVAALIEVAKSLVKERPKRSILFVATGGESPAGPGSKFFAQHPLVPIEKTIASLNLMQLGRTDSFDGPKKMNAAISGFDRSDIPVLFKNAARPLGFDFYDDKSMDVEDERGFRPLLIDAKVPSHTIYVTYGYPDARKVPDEAGKLDYQNMARVTQAIVAGVRSLSNR